MGGAWPRFGRNFRPDSSPTTRIGKAVSPIPKKSANGPHVEPGQSPSSSRTHLKVKYRVIFVPEAETDLGQAVRWYETQTPGCSVGLIRGVEQIVKWLTVEPYAFSRYHGRVRHARVKGFPYALFFVVEETNVTILAIMHLVRNPAILRKSVTKTKRLW